MATQAGLARFTSQYDLSQEVHTSKASPITRTVTARNTEDATITER